ncbi:thioredoxin-like protein [Xylaria arbuscula]|nr:thioredoxin-like protein [Xylaria arbuscula]
MPSPRRLRFFMVMVLAIVVTILFFTSKFRSTTPRDPRTINSFFGKTVNGLDQRRGGSGQVVATGKGLTNDKSLKDHDGDGSVDEDDEKLAQEMAERLRAAEQQAKDQANAKAPLKPDSPSDVIGVGSSANGQKKGKNRISKAETDDDKDDDEEEEEEEEEEAADQNSEAEVTLYQILQKSPVVIFSKSYCPYSKKAKGILLEKYIIEPTPYVVELDEHPLGSELQDLLAQKTGRRTVPNIMIHGKSVGGSDDIAGLDTRKTLIDKFKSMGGKKISMKERFTGNAKDKSS